MGRVWRARDEVLHRTVAVKELRAGLYASEAERAQLHARTQNEARAAARINHPGVVTVHDVLEHDDRPWIVMEYVDGPSMADALQETGGFDAREAARIGLHVLGALRAAHTVGVLHRDVKPGNVMLARDGRVLLTDFGIAAIEGDSNLTRTGELIGSVDYLAPERIRGEDPGPASDLWSLGATLYTAVEERSPFHRTSPLGTLQAVVAEEPAPTYRAGALAPVIVALLRKEVAGRPGAEEAQRMLLEAMEGRQPQQVPPHPPTRRVTEEELQAPAHLRPTASGPLPGQGPSGHPQAQTAGHPPGPQTGQPVGHPPGYPLGTAAGHPAGHPSGYPVGPAWTPVQGATQGQGHRPPPVTRRAKAVLGIVAAAVVGGGAVFGAIQFLGDEDGTKGTAVRDSADRSGGRTPQGEGDKQSRNQNRSPDRTPDTHPDPTTDNDTAPAPGAGPDPTPSTDPDRSGAGANSPGTELPAGWRLRQEDGFSVPVPEGWQRDASKPGQYDFSPDNGRHLIRINVDPDPDYNSPYRHLADLGQYISGRLPEYRQLRLEEGTYRDRPSARLDFTFTERDTNPGPRFAVDHMHFASSSGPEYAIYVTGPLADRAQTLERFDTLLKGWRHAG
ncbi:protein kinase [Streptomyces sp. NPDC058657]|uniref:protein kinase domain-containing protein n=1 Tax=unclassified Streptomyces TaxID=2593676 RepID=UPI0036684815